MNTKRPTSDSDLFSLKPLFAAVGIITFIPALTWGLKRLEQSAGSYGILFVVAAYIGVVWLISLPGAGARWGATFDDVPGLAELRKRDPAFDSTAFLRRAASGFVKLQTAWSSQDPAPIRAFLSDGVAQRFELQVGIQRARGWRYVFHDLGMSSIQIVAATSSEAFDALHVRFDASSVIRKVDLNGEPLEGGEVPRKFSDVWTFLRRRGAGSRSGAGLLESRCPSCGTRITAEAKCPSCGTWLQSGELDWVLAGVCDASAWEPESESASGWTELAASDRGACVEGLCDRASAAFWRWQTAMFKGDSAYLAPLSPSGVEPAGRSADGTYWVDVSARSMKLERAEVLGESARARIRFLAEGEKFERGVSCGEQQLDGVVTLERRLGTPSPAWEALRSLVCPGCGAPASSPTALECAYCRRPMNEVGGHWLVSSIGPA
jgi:hypothetical protein